MTCDSTPHLFSTAVDGEDLLAGVVNLIRTTFNHFPGYKRIFANCATDSSSSAFLPQTGFPVEYATSLIFGFKEVFQ